MAGLFRVRLNCVDHYQAAPTEFDPPHYTGANSSQYKDGTQVPVIRAFGATETGQKVCAHIHGAFPYLYIEYEGSLAQDAVDAYIHNLRLAIDSALAVSYRRDPYDGRAIFVAHISLVKGIPFYGYHVGYKYYLKIYLLNPLNMARLADLLYQKAILQRLLQPYESHLQYILQWMCDYNLYGCAYIDCEKVKFRGPVPDFQELSNPDHRWHDRSIPSNWISNPELFPRQSHCMLEVDVHVQDIVNRREIQQRHLHYDFIERLHTAAPDEKLVHSMAGLWRDETRRRKIRMGLSDPSSSPFPPEVLISMSAGPRDTEHSGWIHEEEYRVLVESIVDDEKNTGNGRKTTFDNFIQPAPLEHRVQTAMESVEDLFPAKLSRAAPISLADSMEQVEELFPTNSFSEGASANIPDANSQDFPSGSDKDATAENGKIMLKTNNGNTDDHAQNIDSEAWVEDGDIYPDFDSSEEKLLKGLPKAVETRNILSSEQNSKRRLDDLDWTPAGKDAFALKMSAPSSPNKRQKLDEAVAAEGLQLKSGTEDARNERTTVQNGLHSRPLSFDSVLGPTKSEEMAIAKNEEDSFGLGPSSLSQSSQRSIKAHGVVKAGTLAFPVVKDPRDLDTTSKLSQGGGLSSTQSFSQSTTPRGPSQSISKDESPKTAWSRSKSSQVSTEKDFRISSEVLSLAKKFASVFIWASSSQTLLLSRLPPSADLVQSTMAESGRPPVIYQDAYYSNERDAPERPREYAGREFKLGSITTPFLPDFDPTGMSPASFGQRPPVLVDKTKEELLHKRRRQRCTLRNWEIANIPPTFHEVERWLQRENLEEDMGDPGEADVDLIGQRLKEPRPPPELSQLDAPTQRNKHGFKYSQNKRSTSVKHETQYMSIMSLEVHINTRGSLRPDPAEDRIECVFWCIQDDDHESDSQSTRDNMILGILALSENGGKARKIARHVSVEVEEEDNELDLINRMVDIVRRYDPDILTGYEVHDGSWGYLIERARVKYDYNLCDEFSRMKSQSHGRAGKEADRWGFQQTSTIRVTGRHMINVWRAMRGELNLLQYTLENVAFHLLHKRIPHYTFQDLTKWYNSERPRDLAKTIDYFVSRVQLNLQILEANEIIPRTSEQARLLGVDFFSVFSRGSQFKVESLMFRIAKAENFMLVSPSRKQVGQQNALECLPLVMEPQSAFYPSPLLVLDFQSLYPSIMIAYNYCYSTCLGRVVSWRGTNKLGFTDFRRAPKLLELVKDHINISPNGMMYVKPELRKSLLAKMLGEILETRVMVKSGMKVDKDDKTLQQLLNNRQLALKLIANVTYGYTSASFSGRMPCSEIADSIVQTARETLEKAISMIHSVERWGAEVVYGDTDSLFVYLKGRTRDEAFDIGNQIAKAVTDANPRPVKLKFEKVYHPCVLLAKKRYVGFKYESRTQTVPEFDAKGIETVRRDGTPAEQKIEEKALKILFRTSDLSQVKSYFQRQCAKIMAGRVSIQDFCFAREVKLGTYSEKGPPPPGALIATRRMLADPRAEPQYGERVPYVVVTGAPGARLIDRCIAPEILLGDNSMELDTEYYISKNIIPPLERIFNLVGANVRQWYDETPKIQRIRANVGGMTFAANGKAPVAPIKRTIEAHFVSSACIICRAKLPPARQLFRNGNAAQLALCAKCAAKPSTTLLVLRTKLRKAEARKRSVEDVCRSCAGLAFADEIRCDSRDCPVFYTRVKEGAALAGLQASVNDVIKALENASIGSKQDFDW